MLNRFAGYKKTLKNPHFWIILAISLFLLYLYSLWPWRERSFPEFMQPWISFLYELALFEIITRIVGVLFFIPIVYATIVFLWQGALFTSLLAFIGVVPIIIGWAIPAVISNLLILLLPFLWVSISAAMLERRRKEKERLVERTKEHKLYLQKITQAEEKERQRIAHDIHDETIQELLVMRRIAGNLAVDSNSDPVQQQANSIVDICDHCVDNLRRICLRLRPDILNIGLIPALRWLVDRINQRKITHVNLEVTGEERRLSDNLEITIFRIVQEALNNVTRHAQANSAYVNLEFCSDRIKLTIKDDGIGFDSKQVMDNLVIQGKLGIVGIRQRIESIGGVFLTTSLPGEGTQISIEVKTGN